MEHLGVRPAALDGDPLARSLLATVAIAPLDVRALVGPTAGRASHRETRRGVRTREGRSRRVEAPEPSLRPIDARAPRLADADLARPRDPR